MQKTQKKKLTLLDYGELVFKEVFRCCSKCHCVFGSETLGELAPEHSNFGFDIIEFIGRKIFIDYRTEKEVHQALEKRNVKISIREISFLAKKFILYLAQAHKEKEEAVGKLIRAGGGFIVHLDGTCDGASSHFFCVVEEQLKLVLLSRKIPSESAEEIAPILQALKERD